MSRIAAAPGGAKAPELSVRVTFACLYRRRVVARTRTPRLARDCREPVLRSCPVRASSECCRILKRVLIRDSIGVASVSAGAATMDVNDTDTKYFVPPAR